MSVSMGYRYRSAALLEGDSDDNLDGDIIEDPRSPSGRVGTRAPHVVVERDGQQMSTIDLYHRDLVLLAGPDDGTWVDAATSTAQRLGIQLRAHQFGPNGDLSDVEDSWVHRHGVGTDGAVLVRPDGHIAWRSRRAVAQPANVLNDVLTQVLAR
jgi:putative polyketide hydroxylase